MAKKATKKIKRVKKSKQCGKGFWSDAGDWISDNIVAPVDNILKKTKLISKVIEPALTYVGTTIGTAAGAAIGIATLNPELAPIGSTLGTAAGAAAGGALKDYAEQHGYGNKFHNNLILGQAIAVSHLKQKGLGAKHRIRAKHMQTGCGSPFLNPTTSSYGGVKF